MLLGDDHEFSLAVDGIEITRCYNIDMLGVNIGSNKFNFDRRVTNLHCRVNKQLQVIKKFRKLITGQTRLKLYNAFITACFRYCSNMWHFCSAHSRDKLEQLNKQILEVVLKDSSSIYEDLLTKLNMTNLEAGRVQSMMVTLYKCLNGMAPSYLRAYIQEWRVSNDN